jgi:hypothetical protein
MRTGKRCFGARPDICSGSGLTIIHGGCVEGRKLLGRQRAKAADAAARWHVHHRRKGPADEPYINHQIEVAMLVADATGGSECRKSAHPVR